MPEAAEATPPWRERLRGLYRAAIMCSTSAASAADLDAYVFAAVSQRRDFRRLRPLCEAVGIKPPDGANSGDAAAWWLRLLEMPEDYHDKLWQIFADHIVELRQAVSESIERSRVAAAEVGAWMAERENRRNALIARQACDIQQLKDRLQKGGRLPKDELNIRAREFLKKHPNAKSRQLAKGIGCAHGLVSKLPVWRAVQERREKERRPTAPHAVALTPKLEKTLPQDDTELERLIKDQRQEGMTDGSLLKPSERSKKAKSERAKKPKFVPRRQV